MVQVNRRHFLKGAAAAFAAPYIIPSTCFGANERATVGCIGFGGQGKGILQRFLQADCNVAGVCDVDAARREEALKIVAKEGRQSQEYVDYRDMLDRKDLDAIAIVAPDHWHALMTINGCQAGKDVYCEKPLSLTIMDGRRMANAAKEHGRIVQTGSQQRSGSEFWKACMLVQNGAIGEVETVLAGIAPANHPGPLGPDSDPPAGLNYDLWLGPARYRPYNEKRVHYNFRFWWDYSGGQMTNWGAHFIDIAQWGLGMDDSGPVASEGTATFHPQMVHEVTESCRVTHTYGNGVKLIVGQRQDDIPIGTTFIGKKGTIFVTRGKLTADKPEILEQDFESLKIQLPKSDNHVQNFLDSVKTRSRPVCDAEVGHRSATVCHLGNIVCRLGRSIEWNPETEQILNDPEAQAMADRDYREPWRHDGL